MLRLPAVLALLALPLAGCLAPGAPEALGPAATGLDGAVPALAWQGPQMASHPAFGWPTMNQPAPPAGVEVSRFWRPIAPRALPEDITTLTRAAGAAEPHSGAGIAVFGSLVAVPNVGGQEEVAFRLYDIADPLAPVLLAAPQGTPGRDAEFLAYPDGRLALVMASNYGVNPVWDVTEPAQPRLLAEIEPSRGSHNLLVVPGTPILYNGNSRGGGPAGDLGIGEGVTEIYDLTEPAAPELVQEFANGFGCHDLTAFIDAAEAKYRAYCAGIEQVQVWDIADPRAPVVLASFPLPHGRPGVPGLSLLPYAPWAHSAYVNHDASVLIVGDETGGGGAPGCDLYADAGPRTVSGPLGNLWFFDLRDERAPGLRSWLSPSSTLLTNDPQREDINCTSHFGRILEDRNQAAWGFYSAGVLLVDFTDLDHPHIRAQFKDGSNTWDVWHYQGYLFTGDLARGFDVLLPE